MGSIRFGQSQQNISPAVLNHQTASPLKANNIQIRIGSDYLKDFTPAGIESFVDKHTKFFESGDKKLDAGQVKAFIQKLAQNPDEVKGMTFDLKDPELGLLRNDGVEKRHIEGAFQMDFEDTSQLAKGSAADVKFVDVKSVSFDIKDKEDTISGAQQQITTLRDEKKGLQRDLGSAQDELALAQRVIGNDALKQYEELSGRQSEIAESLEGLDTQEAEYKAELEAEDTTPERKTELRHILAGIGEERKALNSEKSEIGEKLSKDHGPLLQRYALKDLPGLQEKVEAKAQSIRDVDSKIKEQVGIVEGAVDPVAEGVSMPDKAAEPAAENPDVAATPAVTPAETADEVPEETIQVGPKPELEALKDKPVKHQAQLLKDMPAADQKSFVSSLSTEERAALKTEVEGFIESTEATSGARFRNANTKYKALLEVVNESATSTQTTVAEEKTTTTTTVPAETAAETPAAPSNVTEGAANEDIPEDGLSRKSKPLKVNGEVVTKSSFKSLAINDKFDILMKADKEFLRDLLTSMTKEERSQIRTLAKARVAKYASSFTGTVSSSSSTVRIQRNEDGTAAYVRTDANGRQQVTSITQSQREEMERAQYILDIIAELDGPEAGSSTTTSTTTTTTTNNNTTVNRNNQTTVDTSVATEGLQTVEYRVRPGETANSIAHRQYGNRLRGQEILRLNPELEESVKRRAEGREYTNVELVDKGQQDLTITILHKDEQALDDPVRTSTPAVEQPVAARPKLVEEEVPAPQPKTTPQPAETPAPKPAAEHPTLTDEDKPAPPPRAAS